MIVCLDEPMGPAFFIFFNKEIDINGPAEGLYDEDVEIIETITAFLLCESH